MPTSLATVSLIVVTLLACQVFLGRAVTSEFASVSRRLDPASFWGSILNQCVAIAITAVVSVGFSTCDWAKLSKSLAPRRGG
jgi:hypothetical protein